jgi:hypothetical protein
MGTGAISGPAVSGKGSPGSFRTSNPLFSRLRGFPDQYSSKSEVSGPLSPAKGSPGNFRTREPLFSRLRGFRTRVPPRARFPDHRPPRKEAQGISGPGRALSIYDLAIIISMLGATRELGTHDVVFGPAYAGLGNRTAEIASSGVAKNFLARKAIRPIRQAHGLRQAQGL